MATPSPANDIEVIEKLSDLYLALWRLLANSEDDGKWFDAGTATDEELIGLAKGCVKALEPYSATDAERDFQTALAAKAQGGEELADARDRFAELGMLYARQADDAWGPAI